MKVIKVKFTVKIKLFILLPLLIFFQNKLFSEEWIGACEENYPPYNYIENGFPTGLDTEIVQHVMNKIGKKIIIRTANWSNVYKNLLESKVDLAWQFIGSEERKKLFFLVGPIRYGLDVILVRKSSNVSNWTSLNDFSGLKAGVIKGYKYHHEFDTANNFKKKEFPNVQSQLEALISNKVDFIIGDFNVMKYIIKKNNYYEKVKFLPTSIKKIPRFIAFSNKDKEKSILFEHYLQEFLSSQEYSDLLDKYEKLNR